MYALYVNAETGRILAATFPKYATEGQPLVETLPNGDIRDYLYKDGEYIYDPLPKPEEPEPPVYDYEARIAALEEELAATKILLGVE